MEYDPGFECYWRHDLYGNYRYWAEFFESGGDCYLRVSTNSGGELRSWGRKVNLAPDESESGSGSESDYENCCNIDWYFDYDGQGRGAPMNVWVEC
ncbi:MAG: hypothetical protein GX594_14790 [Pirellulaceae bacterium]|nr:hypothetical protein [Pirellulaceae bacterium]